MALVKDGEVDVIEDRHGRLGTTAMRSCGGGETGLHLQCSMGKWEFTAKEQGSVVGKLPRGNTRGRGMTQTDVKCMEGRAGQGSKWEHGSWEPDIPGF